MKLHHTKYKKNYRDYILSTIETDYDEKPLVTDKDKIKFINNRFNSEYGFMIDRVGKQKAMTEWLQGLALNIEYNNHDILELAKKMGSIPKNPDRKLQERVIENYWAFMANIILGLK